MPLEHGAVSEPLPARIRYDRHDGAGLQQMWHFLGVRPEDLVYSNGLGWAVEEVQALTHTGAHVDAPYHYGPTSEGKPARTIDQVPLEWCLAPGVVLDVRHKAAGACITAADLEAALGRYGGRLAAKEAVVKAIGTGFSGEVSWTEVEILRLPSGQPEVSLSGSAKTVAEGLGVTRWLLSISHSNLFAVASAIAVSDYTSRGQE